MREWSVCQTAGCFREHPHRRRHATLELVVVVGIEDVVLAVILVLHHALDGGKAGLEHAMRRLALQSRAISVASPGHIGPRQIGVALPAALVDQSLQTGTVSSRLRAEYAAAGQRTRLLRAGPRCR